MHVLILIHSPGAATGVLGVPVGPLMKSNPRAVPDFLYILRQVSVLHDTKTLLFAQMLTSRKYNYSFVVTGILAIGFIKTSVSFFYLQVFCTQNYRPFIIAWIVIMTLWTISFFTAFLAICGDHGVFSSRIFSDAKNVKKYCGSTRQLDFGVLISGTLSDLLTVLLPIPMV
jgi:hypothetical protein